MIVTNSAEQGAASLAALEELGRWSATRAKLTTAEVAGEG